MTGQAGYPNAVIITYRVTITALSATTGQANLKMFGPDEGDITRDMCNFSDDEIVAEYLADIEESIRGHLAEQRTKFTCIPT